MEKPTTDSAGGANSQPASSGSLRTPARGGADATSLRLEEVTVLRGGRPVVDRVSWEVQPGQRWAVLGPNGAGKSTLAAVIAAIDRPSRGTAHVLGAQLGRTELQRLRQRVGFVGSDLDRRLHPRLSAREAVATGRHAMLRRWHERYTDADWDRADRLLDELGVGGLAGRRVGTLSDGERRRVQIARALMPAPELLVLDEPTAGLDLGAREHLLTRLDRIGGTADGPQAVVLVCHLLHDIPSSFGHALLLRDGRVVAAGPIDEVLTGAALSSCFGVSLAVSEVGDRRVAWTPAGSR